MIEYDDGHFSEIMPQEEAVNTVLERFLPDEDEEPNTPPIRALHFGTKEELEQRKKKHNLEERLSELERKVAAQEQPQSSLLHLPTAAERRAVLDEPPKIDPEL